MNIIIFLIILSLLVIFHEAGHFIIAKKNGVRVDEFGLGFPPRLFGKKIGETVYSLNLLPFGGFVKIFGENSEGTETSEGNFDTGRSLVHKSKLVQASVLSGGVLFNIIFAWIIISLGLTFGLPMAVDQTNVNEVKDARLMISSVLPKSPAEDAGLKAGDILLSLKTDSKTISENINPDLVREFIGKSDDKITLKFERGKEVSESVVEAKEGVVSDGKAIGISMDMVGTLKFPIYKAFYKGFFMTGLLVKNVTLGIIDFFSKAFVGKVDFSSVAGPVGMVTLVGDARTLGFDYLIFFTALLSINLAVINLLPFPALDGGRLLMVIFEAIVRKPIKPKFVQIINTAGFGILLLLMLIITYHDIAKLF